MAELLYDIKDHIATIVLNRPERKNAFTVEMVEAWAQYLRTAQSDPAVRAVIVKGAGGAFCSGVDLRVFDEYGTTPLAQKALLTDHVHQVAHAARELSKPYIAAVSGVAVGAGMDMSLMADIRIAGQSARLSEGYVRVGLVPGDGGCYYLPRIVGTANALQLLGTGEFVDADRARSMGLVSSVVPDDELDEAATALATSFANQPPLAVQTIKRAMYSALAQDLPTHLDTISSHLAVVASSEDAAEARAAFSEHRPGNYTGR